MKDTPMDLKIADTQPIFDELTKIYEHPSRKYHNLDHIHNMLEKLTESERYAEHPHRILLVIWFHDIVYDAKRTDNELKSAEFWIRKMTPYLLEEPLQWGKLAILSTINHYPNTDSDIQLLLDLDLTSLGAPWEVFQNNSENIRQEYMHIPDKVFYAGRRDFLTQMIERPRLYGTNYWYNVLEERARDNIKKIIECGTG